MDHYSGIPGTMKIALGIHLILCGSNIYYRRFSIGTHIFARIAALIIVSQLNSNHLVSRLDNKFVGHHFLVFMIAEIQLFLRSKWDDMYSTPNLPLALSCTGQWSTLLFLRASNSILWIILPSVIIFLGLIDAGYVRYLDMKWLCTTCTEYEIFHISLLVALVGSVIASIGTYRLGKFLGYDECDSVVDVQLAVSSPNGVYISLPQPPKFRDVIDETNALPPTSTINPSLTALSASPPASSLPLTQHSLSEEERRVFPSVSSPFDENRPIRVRSARVRVCNTQDELVNHRSLLESQPDDYGDHGDEESSVVATTRTTAQTVTNARRRRFSAAHRRSATDIYTPITHQPSRTRTHNAATASALPGSAAASSSTASKEAGISVMLTRSHTNMEDSRSQSKASRSKPSPKRASSSVTLRGPDPGDCVEDLPVIKNRRLTRSTTTALGRRSFAGAFS